MTFLGETSYKNLECNLGKFNFSKASDEFNAAPQQ